MKIKSVLIMLIIGFISSLWINFAINQKVLGQTPEQISQLKEAEVPVILPTYIPQGFRLIDFQSGVGDERVKVSWNYTATYKGPNNSCFGVSGTNGPVGAGETLIRQWSVDTNNFGSITLREVMYPNARSTNLTANFFIRYSSSDAANYFFDSPDSSCNSISPQEASKIIRSWQFKYP